VVAISGITALAAPSTRKQRLNHGVNRGLASLPEPVSWRWAWTVPAFVRRRADLTG